MNINESYIYFVYCKKDSEFTRTQSFLIQLHLIWLFFFVLTFGLWVRCSGLITFFWNFWIFFFVNLVPFEILSHYANIDRTHWPRENVQRNIDKIFWKKGSGLNDFDTFFSHIFWCVCVFGCFSCWFYSHKTYFDVLLITYARKLPCSPIFYISKENLLAVIFSILVLWDQCSNFIIFSWSFWIFVFFLVLVPFETLSNYPNIDSSSWLGKDVERIICKTFRLKPMV